MGQFTANVRADMIARAGGQPIALAAATLLVVVVGVAIVALWRTYAGVSPELDRIAFARQLQQARAAQVSEQLVEKTRGLQATQQESIDDLQVMQDQLRTVRHLLEAQQADTKRLSEQVAGLSEAIDGLRKSFASAQSTEPSDPPARNGEIRARAHHALLHRRARSGG